MSISRTQVATGARAAEANTTDLQGCRFYRRKYDAARTIAAFSATLRHEMDLDDLSRQLVAVVRETMQPSHVSLWLRPTAPHRKDQSTGSTTPPP